MNLADGEPLLVGWVRQEAQNPAVRDHAGCLTLPRRLQLVGGLVVSRVDPGAAATLAGDVFPLGAGTTVLADRRWVVEVVGVGARLTHPALGEVQLVPGSQLWVDGAVTELYRPSGVPGTWRHDEPWSLVVTSEGAVEAREVIPRVP